MSVAVTVSTVQLTTLSLAKTDKPFQLCSYHTNKVPTCYSPSHKIPAVHCSKMWTTRRGFMDKYTI